MKANSIRMFAVGFTDNVEQTELRAIATDPDVRHAFHVEDDSDASYSSVIQDLVSNICRDVRLCTDAADLAFILDTSGSVNKDWRAAINFSMEALDLLPVGKNNVRVAAIAYSTYAYIQFGFDKYFTKPELAEALNNIFYNDHRTNTSGAIRLGRLELFNSSYGSRPNIRNVAVVITDGQSNMDTNILGREAEMAHKRGIQIYAVGIGEKMDIRELNLIASNPDVAHVISTKSPRKFVEKALTLKWGGCLDSLPVVCMKALDLIIVLDVSGSIGSRNFVVILDFLKKLVKGLDIDSGLVRVGLITFGTETEVEFFLNQYELMEDVQDAISRISYRRGTTNTARALEDVRTYMTSPKNGNRDNVPTVVLVFTDGRSDQPEDTLQQAKLLNNKDVHVISVGIGTMYELFAMATEPRRLNTYYMPIFYDLYTFTSDLQEAVCNSVNECSSSPCQNAGTCQDAILTYQCTCPEGFAGINCQIECFLGSDIIFALDASGSVGEKNFYGMLEFVRDIVRQISVNDDYGNRIGLLTFGSWSDIQINLGNYSSKEQLMTSMYFSYAGGTTNTSGAIDVIQEMFRTGGRSDKPKIAFIITDGRSNRRTYTWLSAVEARNAGIHLISIGVGYRVNKEELRGIASGGGDQNVFLVEDFDRLGTLTPAMVAVLCNTVNECATNPCENGAQCIDSLQGFKCTCASGYKGELCEIESKKYVDVAFLLDSSGSIGRKNYKYMTDFIKDVTMNLDIGPSKDQVAVVLFETDSYVRMGLKTYTDKYDITHDLETIRYSGGATYTFKALQMVREKVLTFQNGDRPDAQNFVVILTDGHSNDMRKTLMQARSCRQNGTYLIIIGIGSDDWSRLECIGMASEPFSQTFFKVATFTDLRDIVSNVTSLILDDTDYCAVTPNCQHGGTCVNGIRQFKCQCPTDYSGRYCERVCSRDNDVVFMLDVSGDIIQYYEIILKFMRHIIEGLNVNSGAARVAYVTFNDKTSVRFSFKQMGNEEDVLEKLYLQYFGGGTYFFEAIRTVREKLLSENWGDRPSVNNTIILITDGYLYKADEKRLVDLEMERLQETNTDVFSVGLGVNANPRVLSEFASQPETIFVHNLNKDTDALICADAILEILCND